MVLWMLSANKAYVNLFLLTNPFFFFFLSHMGGNAYSSFSSSPYPYSSFYSKVTKERHVSTCTTKALYSSEVTILRKMSILRVLSSEVLCACFSRSFHMHKADRWQPLRANLKSKRIKKKHSTWNMTCTFSSDRWIKFDCNAIVRRNIASMGHQ